MSDVPTPQEFFTTFPLYQAILLPNKASKEKHLHEQKKLVWEILKMATSIEAWGKKCGQVRTFQPSLRMDLLNRPIVNGATSDILHKNTLLMQNRVQGLDVVYLDDSNSPFDTSIVLTHFVRAGVANESIQSYTDGNHLITHVLAFSHGDAAQTSRFRKIGQWPSPTDLQRRDLTRLSKVMSVEDRKDFEKAQMLHGYGIHVASYTYLRRILERILEQEARSKAREESTFDYDEWRGNHMKERFKLLSDRVGLHEFPMDAVYSHLSGGIHDWDEQSCANGFETLADDLVLNYFEEKGRERKQDERKQRLGSGLSGIMPSKKSAGED